MNISYWEQSTWFSNCDLVIVGSGIVGLNAALSLKTAAPALKILVLERGLLPSGASTKNAGFACYGSPSELLDDLKSSDEQTVFSLVEKRWKGLVRLRKNLGDKAIAYEGLGGYEVFEGEQDFSLCAEKLDFLNKRIGPVTGLPRVYAVADRKISSFGLGRTAHLIENSGEGQIHTGRMMAALISKVQSLGVMILNNFPVKSFSENGGRMELEGPDGIRITTRKLLLATNGFARQFLPEMDVKPARAQVLVTSPIPGLKLKGAFHFDKGFYYFRDVEGRVLLGGGRNLDFKTEETSEFGLTQLVQDKLEELLQTMVIPGMKYTIEQRWSGIMGVGNRKSSIVKAVSDNLFCAVRMGGMGVAIGSLVGEEAAELLLKSL